MSWCSRPSAWATALLMPLLPAPLTAQGWREAQLITQAVFSDPAMFTGGIGLAWRDAGRTRLSLSLASGATGDGPAAGRGELAVHFLLDPARRRGASLYGGGGLAVTAAESDRPRAWLLLALGVEWNPAGNGGAFIEAGAGGGVRLAAGIRIRKRNAPSR